MLHKTDKNADLRHIAEGLNKLPPEALERLWQFVQQLQKARTEKEDA